MYGSESAESGAKVKAEFLEPKGAMEGGIMVNFQPSAAGEYPGRLVMRSNLETRVYDFYFTVKHQLRKKPWSLKHLRAENNPGNPNCQ